MIEYVGLDFETYSDVDLPVHGLFRYTKGKHFRPLIAAAVVYNPSQSSTVTVKCDFTDYYDAAVLDLREAIGDRMIVAHNAGFEREVLRAMGIELPASRFIDSAALARAAGAGGKLEEAAPQLLGTNKMEDGMRLIRLFSIPSKQQREDGDLEFDPNLKVQHPQDWATFMRYCVLDAELSLRLWLDTGSMFTERELQNQAITMEMNQLGWPVDVEVVKEMQRRYIENQQQALEDFRRDYDAADLNLNSLQQMKEWCAKRGIRASSFDEKHVEKLLRRLKTRLDQHDDNTKPLADDKYMQYVEVCVMLETKQAMGGSSLKKLQTILDTVSEDGRLRDQYLHIGAGQSWRTTGRSTQMQNLKRFEGDPMDMDTLLDDDSEWTNHDLALNIRQCFTSSHPGGALIVGDLSSVESRKLAWLANAHWKLDAYRQGKDMYKVLATDMFPGVAYDAVTKGQRQSGKVGELSCGYQAGGGAVASFAAGMGIEMTEAEAAQLVSDWRTANPETVELWDQVDQLLHAAMAGVIGRQIRVGYDYSLDINRCWTPPSLLKQHPGAQSLELALFNARRELVLRRVFHGCYMRGRSVCFYKPSKLKSGELWKNHFTDPKTKQIRFHSIYGGKLVGILTQSFCRETFFNILRNVQQWVDGIEGLDIIGQFHDEIVLDWRPDCHTSLELAKEGLEFWMTQGAPREFPIGAEIKHDYRYTK